jgi:hypothetical protein
MSTQVVCAYTVGVIGLQSQDVIGSEMLSMAQGGAGPDLPLGFLYAIGVRPVSDVVTHPAGEALRTVTLALVPNVDATATATVFPGARQSPVAFVTLTGRGLGYVAPPIISFVPAPDQDNEIAAAVADLRLNSVTVGGGGLGYTSPTATAVGGLSPGGTPATLSITLGLGGVITAINVVTPGSGYFAPPEIVITDVAPPTVPAAAVVAVMELDTITLTTGGNNYDPANPPTIVITPRFKSTWPDSIGPAAQAAPFFNMLTVGLEVSTMALVLPAPPVVS